MNSDPGVVRLDASGRHPWVRLDVGVGASACWRLLTTFGTVLQRSMDRAEPQAHLGGDLPQGEARQGIAEVQPMNGADCRVATSHVTGVAVCNTPRYSTIQGFYGGRWVRIHMYGAVAENGLGKL